MIWFALAALGVALVVLCVAVRRLHREVTELRERVTYLEGVRGLDYSHDPPLQLRLVMKQDR